MVSSCLHITVKSKGCATRTNEQRRYLSNRTMRWLITIFLFLNIGCTATRIDYEKLSQIPTPPNWQEEGTWQFNLFDKEDRPLGHAIMIFEHTPAQYSCGGANDLSITVLSSEIIEGITIGDFGLRPAYSITGSHINIDLTAHICDINDVLQGQITETGAKGLIFLGGLMGRTHRGKFSAEVVPR